MAACRKSWTNNYALILKKHLRNSLLQVWFSGNCQKRFSFFQRANSTELYT